MNLMKNDLLWFLRSIKLTRNEKWLDNISVLFELNWIEYTINAFSASYTRFFWRYFVIFHFVISQFKLSLQDSLECFFLSSIFLWVCFLWVWVSLSLFLKNLSSLIIGCSLFFCVLVLCVVFSDFIRYIYLFL